MDSFWVKPAANYFYMFVLETKTGNWQEKP